MITPELVHKHIKRLVEVTVKSHTRHSKKGKAYAVGSYNRQTKTLHALSPDEKTALLDIARQADDSEANTTHPSAVRSLVKKGIVKRESLWGSHAERVGGGNRVLRIHDKWHASVSKFEDKDYLKKKKARRAAYDASIPKGGKFAAKDYLSRRFPKKSSAELDTLYHQAMNPKKRKRKQAPPGIVPGQGTMTDFWGNRYK